MERVSLEAAARAGGGKRVAKAVRREGRVPAVVYGRGTEPLPVSLDARALVEALHTGAGANVLIDLTVRTDGEARTETVMITEVQRDPLRRVIIHADLHRIDLTHAVKTHVPVVLRGTARGVSEGGVVEQPVREILVEALPTEIPEHFDIEVADLGLGATLHVRDLPGLPGVKILTPPDEVVLLISVPRGVEEEAPAAAPVAEVVEPEVIAKGKTQEEEEE